MHEIVLYDIDADNRGHLQVSVPRLCDAVYTWRGGGQWVNDSALSCDWLRNIANNVLERQWI